MYGLSIILVEPPKYTIYLFCLIQLCCKFFSESILLLLRKKVPSILVVAIRALFWKEVRASLDRACYFNYFQNRMLLRKATVKLLPFCFGM